MHWPAQAGQCTEYTYYNVAGQPAQWFKTKEDACLVVPGKVEANSSTPPDTEIEYSGKGIDAYSRCVVTRRSRRLTTDAAGNRVWSPWSEYDVFFTANTRETACLSISLEGPGATHALPAGPVLQLTARVVGPQGPVANALVTIRSSKTGGSLGAYTDAAGEYRFTYVPPFLSKFKDELIGSCSACTSTAVKAITVEHCDVCGSR